MDVIFDVDGTLLNIEHRVHLIRPQAGARKDWKLFRAEAIHDTPCLEMVTVNAALYAAGHNIIIATGRMEHERPILTACLDTFGIRWTGRIYMRANEDLRPDYVIKLELLHRMWKDGFWPQLAFDDRQQVVDMWRAQGIVCAQVAPGKF